MPPIEHHLEGREYWLSLAQQANAPDYVQRAASEFADYDPNAMASMPRRRFMQFMGGSLALAGLTLTGCRRWPKRELAPYAARPHGRVPGVSEQYATVMEIAGVAAGLLISSYDGRPIKVEGNPSHPASRGATDAYAQASVLDLYDPDRSRSVLRRVEGKTRTAGWDDFAAFAGDHFRDAARRDGRGVFVLSAACGGPTLADMRRRMLGAMPAAKWLEYEPISRDHQREAARAAFGQAVRPVYQLDRAKVIALFDADLLGAHPDKVRMARDWAAGRRSADAGTMNRTHVIESGFSLTGSNADYRLPARPQRVEQLLFALAQALKVPNVAEAPELSLDERSFVGRLAAELADARGAGLVAAGDRLSVAAQAVALRINAHLGAVGQTVRVVAEPDADRPTHAEAIRMLTDALDAGEVDTLVLLGVNPVYDAPADLAFGEALAKAGCVIHVGHYVDETAAQSHWHLPQAHYLEAWGDGRAWDGTLGIGQPLIEPLYDGKTAAEVVALIASDAVTGSYDLVRRAFTELLGADDFESRWRRALHDGVMADSQWREVSVSAGENLLTAPNAKAGDGFAVVFAASGATYDGRLANNGWLQETPDPLTKITWDNAALMHPADAKQLGVAMNDVVAIEVDGRKVELPTYVLPGQPKGVIGLTLGYGRTHTGHVGRGVGKNIYALRTTASPYWAANVKVSATGTVFPLACTQDHHPIDPVGQAGYENRVGEPNESGKIIREATLAEYREDPHFVNRNAHGGLALQLFDPPRKFNDPHAWGMAVDLNSCIGCNACSVACQAENNIPVVGKAEVAQQREMHWLRIDRYFKGDVESPTPDVVHQPMMCVHCENAPCEQVCPVAATVHDTEGLNTMVYNRCVGTRYCSNNCPYKVRRFNYYDYHSKDPRGSVQPWLGMPDTQQRAQVDEIKQLVHNPDVTVRMRGVMEKCTYCVQRIQAVKIETRNAGESVTDGQIQSACQQACPTQAIVFGNLNDPTSAVRKLQENNRAYAVLGELNVQPRTRYLARIRNREEAPA
jgi:MoCo/4Fe-4S cofactor protein with predicted Tat translocation signal